MSTPFHNTQQQKKRTPKSRKGSPISSNTKLPSSSSTTVFNFDMDQVVLQKKNKMSRNRNRSNLKSPSQKNSKHRSNHKKVSPPKLALSTSNSLVIRWEVPFSSPSSPKSTLTPTSPKASASTLQYRTKDALSVWHTAMTTTGERTDERTGERKREHLQNEQRDERMSFSMRPTACTIAHLVTYCNPMSFRIRHRLLQEGDEGDQHAEEEKWTSYSAPSDWYQTSPNRPAR